MINTGLLCQQLSLSYTELQGLVFFLTFSPNLSVTSAVVPYILYKSCESPSYPSRCVKERPLSVNR
jgi:hypothetical protein